MDVKTHKSLNLNQWTAGTIYPPGEHTRAEVITALVDALKEKGVDGDQLGYATFTETYTQSGEIAARLVSAP